VVSCSANDLSKDNSRSTMYSKSSSGCYNQNSPEDVSPHLNRWQSESGIASTSTSVSIIHDESRRKDAAESNRESMKALVEFLRTKVRHCSYFNATKCVIKDCADTATGQFYVNPRIGREEY